jgi:replicative DNA helicase
LRSLDFNFPLIVLSQVNRSVPKPLELHSLRGSSALVSTANVVLLVDRDLSGNETDILNVNVIVAKNRHGEIGALKLSLRI